MHGLSLVELMVSLVLGIFVVGSAISLTLANRQSYRTNEGLSQLQESARTAFELLARDFRQTGVTGCDNEGRIANVLVDPVTDNWWTTWFGIRGHDDASDTSAVLFGITTADRVAGTDAVQLQGIEGTPMSVESHTVVSPNADMIVRVATNYPTAGDVLVACDFDHAAIFQVAAFNPTLRQVRHNVGVGTPGNCARGLGFPTSCGTADGTPHLFAANASVSRMFATDWYIGENGRADEGGRSLYRRRLVTGGTLVTEEVVAGVTDMQITYRRGTDTTFTAAGAWTASEWNDVNAVSIVLDVQSADASISTDDSVNSGRIARQFSQIITLRNRVP
jgi:type IV pilus assembly protein PilW